jgi:hypothetical protein
VDPRTCGLTVFVLGRYEALEMKSIFTVGRYRGPSMKGAYMDKFSCVSRSVIRYHSLDLVSLLATRLVLLHGRD